MNALLLVAGYADERLVKLVLDAGADPTSANDFGHTALHLAIVGKRSQLKVLTALADLTLSPPIPLIRLYTLSYWSNPSFFIFDIRALWRSGLSARAPECQKLKMMG